MDCSPPGSSVHGILQTFCKNKKRIVCRKVHHDWPAGSVLSLVLMCTGQLGFRRMGMEMSLCESFQNMHEAVAAPCWDYIPNKLEWLTRLEQSLSNLVKSIYLNSLKCKQDRSCCLNSIRACLWSDAQKRIYLGCTLLPPLNSLSSPLSSVHSKITFFILSA